jgi:type II secretory pathway component PulF
MARQGAVFPEAYLRLVALAEGTGTLPMVLQRLHAGRAKAQALQLNGFNDQGFACFVSNSGSNIH